MNQGNIEIIEKEELEVKNTNMENANTETNETTENTQTSTASNVANSSTTKKPNIGLKAIKITTETIIWTLIVILLAMLVMTTVSKKTDVFGHRLYVILSGSMEPTIHIKQAIVTKEIDEPQVGDIIAFGESDFITVHRVIEVKTEGNQKLYKTKGDNNNAEDKELVKKENIKGKVQYILPAVGETVLFLQQHLMLLVGAIGVLIMIIVIRRLIF